MSNRLFLALLLAASGFAANQPRFAFTVNTTPTPGVLASNTMSPSAIAKDSSGNIYLAGEVSDSPLAATPEAFQAQSAGGTCATGSAGIAPPLPIPCLNAFVMKLDETGNLVFATYLGGSSNVTVSGIAVDSDRNVYVAGFVATAGQLSSDAPKRFPTTPGAAFGSAQGIAGFISKFNASGTQLEYSTFIPGASLAGIAVDSGGNVYFTGFWLNDGRSPFPATSNAFQQSPLAGQAAIVGEINALGSALVYGTYLSGAQLGSTGVGIAVDAEGDALIAGTESDADFPSTTGTFSTAYLSNQNVFLANLGPGGTRLIYASLLGAAAATNLKVDPSGNIYIGVESYSNFPVTRAPFSTAPSTGIYGDFLLKVSPDGSMVLSSLALPFSGVLQPLGMDLDSSGNVYVAGAVENGMTVATTGALQSAFGGGSDALIAKITSGGQVAGVTYLGGSGADSASVIASNKDGSVLVAGATSSQDLAGITSDAIGSSAFFAANLFPAVTVENSASFVANTAVAGELVSIQGYGIGPAQGLNSMPVAQLGGVQVYFDRFAAPITYAQANQINVQVPWEVAGQTTTEVSIVYNGVQAGNATVPVAPAQPGVFYINNSDGSRNSASNSARPGDFVAIYATGGGAMNLPGVTGASWPMAPLSLLAQPVFVTIGHESGTVLYAGSAPTLDSGNFQINVRLPADLGSGAQPICVTVGGARSAPVAISIQ